MKSKVSAVIVFVVIFGAFGVMSSVQSAHENAPQYSTVLVKDGGALATTLVADGPGPMCPPTTGCGYRDLGVGSEERIPPTILLADGTGPMCPPRTGCGYRDLGLGGEERISPTILLVDGTGPMCPPTTGCGYKKDSVVKPSSV
jgi:hypothetical protein